MLLKAGHPMKHSIRQYRAALIITTVVCVVLGILTRSCPCGFRLWDKYLGDALYVACFYLLFGIVSPESRIRGRAALATVFIIACECFQLTGIPVKVSRSPHAAMRWFGYAFLGTHFGWYDMAAYGVGLVSIVLIDTALVERFLVPENDTEC